MAFNKYGRPFFPFRNPGGEPGVLWDGNTAAWYKHNDSRTVFQDGANRVHAWLDRMNYAVGANIIPNPLNFMNANWTVAGGGVKIDNDSFSTGAAGGLRSVNYLWTLNTTYRVRARFTTNAVVALRFYDWNNANLYSTVVTTGALQTIDFCLTVTAIGINGLYFYLSAACIIDFDYLIIEPIAGNHLLQYTAANQPVWSAANGLLFDGANDYLKTLAFVCVQPQFFYGVFRQVTWTNLDRLFDGIIAVAQMRQSPISPGITMNAGAASPPDNNLAVNTFGIVRTLFNGAASILQVNLNAAWNGNVGVGNWGGFTLGADGANINWSNIQVKEIILRRSADNAVTQQQIYDYLRTANGL